MYLSLSKALRTLPWKTQEIHGTVASASRSDMWAKLHTVATSNNEIMRRDHSSCMLVIKFNRSHVSIDRDYTPQSLYYCLFASLIYGYCSSHTFCSW